MAALHAALPAGTDFASATRDLFGWQVHRRAGLRIAFSDEPLRLDPVVVLGLLGVRAPC
ncbi:DUF1990 family protein [Allokutzneria sp. NRRL B-24872]|uniref:DUF1990 family protein n=1 Tax=Allokutzneria sp. NRRL B-24872 TaxID=1137961 RepID=UPI00143D8E64|nr:DUF1990 family protein [Allokutzneria sp. NRRL B-24872]